LAALITYAVPGITGIRLPLATVVISAVSGSAIAVAGLPTLVTALLAERRGGGKTLSGW
jgi:hypothetical protein